MSSWVILTRGRVQENLLRLLVSTRNEPARHLFGPRKAVRASVKEMVACTTSGLPRATRAFLRASAREWLLWDRSGLGAFVRRPIRTVPTSQRGGALEAVLPLLSEGDV